MTVTGLLHQLTPASVQRAMLSCRNWKVFDGAKPYDLNLFGIRSTARKINAFDDAICALYREPGGSWALRSWPATTDPGLYYSQQKLLNPKGVAILKARTQYPKAWKIGKHRGKTWALVQTGGKVMVHRDGNRDDMRDETIEVFEGNYGINIHEMFSGTQSSVRVGRWSAGCQGMPDPDDWAEFRHLIQMSAKLWGSSFSYGILPQQLLMESL